MSSILYCGDTDLNGAASYLAGLMTAWGWTFDYVPSHEPIAPQLARQQRSLLILSDYPAAQFAIDSQEWFVKQIEQGCGLLMIGGWESFHGFGGNWQGTPLGNALPVEIQDQDDRLNFDQSAWLVVANEHPITANLPWSSRPPAIGGMNQVTAKSGTKVLLHAQSFAVSKVESTTTIGADSVSWNFSPRKTLPALVVGQHGKGRTSAFLSDIAPHWVGGFVDWGLPRITGQASSGGAIEVGSHYATFWKQLLQWTGNLNGNSFRV